MIAIQQESHCQAIHAQNRLWSDLKVDLPNDLRRPRIGALNASAFA